MMRQAGRYLPEYRAVREKSDFLTLCKTPELAAEVTIQPVDLVGVDAAIIFSDILVVPEAMGMELVVEEGKGGPQFPTPLANDADVAKLDTQGAADKLQYVYDALALTKKQLDGRVPLIGFAGAPWTLASYAIEGKGSKLYRKIKGLMYDQPGMLHDLLKALADVISVYLVRQVKQGGADIVQIFDSWGGVLSKDAFLEFSLPYMIQIIEHVKSETDVPVILFAKGVNTSYPELANSGADVVGLDWTVDIGEVRAQIGNHVALQGNIDPIALYSRPENIHNEVRGILESYGNHPGHIFNLGHGIDKDTPPEHAKSFIRSVKEMSEELYRTGEIEERKEWNATV